MNMNYSRRKFLQLAGVTAATGVLATDSVLGADLLWRNNSNTLKVGLIGCGGRGTAAAMEALNADPNVVLSAMADAFSDQLEQSYNSLKEKMGDKVQVAQNNKFVGLDAYQKLIATDVDVVLLAAPPAFRPSHLEASVNAKKHIFCEKPFAVDGPGKGDRKSTRLNSSHVRISYAVFCLKKKKQKTSKDRPASMNRSRVPVVMAFHCLRCTN